jgi:hypothetical protein
MEDVSKDLLQRYGAKKEDLYGKDREGIEGDTRSYSLGPRSIYCTFLIRDCRVGG